MVNQEVRRRGNGAESRLGADKSSALNMPRAWRILRQRGPEKDKCYHDKEVPSCIGKTRRCALHIILEGRPAANGNHVSTFKLRDS